MSSNTGPGGLSVQNVAQAQPSTSPTKITKPSFPPPKSDKPRPHVCGTCGRSFARLEHLKRHERSHTKEKPFECPECTRCFARRDLLLRHQQKLHAAGAPSARGRGRRDSSSTQAQSRARKNSLASNVGAGALPPHAMRPRANTISHVDNASFQMMLAQPRHNGMHMGHQHSISEMPDFNGYNGFTQVSQASHLPRIETSGLGVNIAGGLRTAPVGNFDLDKLFAGHGHTVNPAQLHSFEAQGTPESPFSQTFAPHNPEHGFETIDWASATNMQDAMLDGLNEGLGDHSSPSAISTGSLSGFSEVMVDGTGYPAHSSAGMWSNPMVVTPTPAQFSNDPLTAAHFPELLSPGTIAPNELHELHDNKGNGSNFFTLNAASLTSMSPLLGSFDAVSNPPLRSAHMSFGSDTADTFISMGSAASSITDAGRQALLYMLSQAGFEFATNNLPQSPQASVSSGFNQSTSRINLPSTADLQRYVDAYVKYFHPHAPFMHIPTLNLNSPTFTSNLRRSSSFAGGIVGGGGCLTLAIAAIGAAYEFEHEIAMELFEAAKKMFNFYLEARRKAQSTMGGHHSSASSGHQSTPLWLVQAMLLNLIIGHQCGNPKAIEIASTHCAALLSIARSAGLLQAPDPTVIDTEVRQILNWQGFDPETNGTEKEEYIQWLRWKCVEERKRTLYSIFVLSSFLVIGYNQAPKILNSELQLDLPCDEDLWAAQTPQEWNQLGGIDAAKEKAISCKGALEYLLSTSQRRPSHQRSFSLHNHLGPSLNKSHSKLKPSTFGCYVLINAIHVYIWETRQRHQGKEWKPQETEQLYAHVEPALREWQAAWWSNPRHHLKRPSPHGPLPADCIPLLDLAYIRLYVNLGRTRAGFNERDFNTVISNMRPEVTEIADSLAKQGLEPLSLEDDNISARIKSEASIASFATESTTEQNVLRERLLRKAAFYAADSLAMADKLGATYIHFTGRELPQQVAMCISNCAQVLVEWIVMVQDRTLSMAEMHRHDDSLSNGLEEEDRKLFAKINEILISFHGKMAVEAQSLGVTVDDMIGAMEGGSIGNRLLITTAWLLDKAGVWGITKVMARSMRVQAGILNQRPSFPDQTVSFGVASL